MDAGLRAGMDVLDVGCGSGDVILLAAALVGPTGSVVGIDRDADALARARARPVPAGSPTPAFVHADIETAAGPDRAFDAIVARRVLMYQPDPARAVRTLARRLKPGGIVALQEHDATTAPASLVPFPLHAEAMAWLRAMIAQEGADLHCGYNLYGVLTRAGLAVEAVRAEAIVQTPNAPYDLAGIVEACLQRILARGIATADEVGVDTLRARLDAERRRTDGILIAGLMFGAWARKPAEAG